MVVVESNTGDPRQYVSWRLVHWHRALVHLRQETGICHAAIESSIECGGSGAGVRRTTVGGPFLLLLTTLTTHPKHSASVPASTHTTSAPPAAAPPHKP